MKTIFVLLAVWSSMMIQLHAQSLRDSLPGVYFMQGVMETASGFQLSPDSSFEFFFSQGALDRYGSGKWSVKEGKLVLNSRARPPLDFALVTSKSVPGNFTTIKISEKNTMILGYVDCVLLKGSKPSLQSTDSEGIARYPKQAADSLALTFRLCPDRPSVFPVADKSHNYFEFRIEPWIAEVFFENFTLRIEKNALTGGHPLLEKGNLSYIKE